MKKNIFLGFMLFAISLFSEELSLDSSFGGFSVKVNDSSSENNSSVNSTNAVDELATRLELIETKYQGKLNKLDQKRMKKVIDEMYELLALLPEDIFIESPTSPSANSLNNNTNVSININQNDFAPAAIEEAQPIPAEIAPTAMSSGKFQNFLTSIKNENFGDDKLRIVKIAGKGQHFNIAQVKTVISQFKFDDDKIKVVELLYPKVVDRDNSHQLLDSFTFSSDKEEIEDIISN